MKNTLLLIAIFLCPLFLLSQDLTYDKSKLKGMTPIKVNAASLTNNFNAVIQQVAAPPPSGNSYRDKLALQKAKSAALYPRQSSQIATTRSMADQPTIETSLKGNTSSGGRPLDNNFAVNAQGQMVTMVNSNLTVKGPTGIVQLSITLEDFASSLGTAAFMFDPKVFYDPIDDRYVMTWLGGNTSNASIIVLAFSETNDATGDWNLYGLTGNPNDDGTWSDYPMLTFTDTECFLTLNSIREGESWQAGFEKTIIYQMNKASGYSGQELDLTLWQEIIFDGKLLRNVCPIKPSTETVGDDIFFLSNRNFDIVNDSIFFIHIDGTQDDATLTIDMHKSNLNYGTPPNGEQEEGFLATNDCRILDGYILDDRIEFVGNSIDFNNGRAGVYHGTIQDIYSAPSISAHMITSDTEDYGYPSIGYTGIEPGEIDGIILFSHTGAERAAGHSAVYFEEPGTYSEPLSLKEGSNYIDMIADSDVERWGDYSANQRDYTNPGMVWTASSFANSAKRNATWLTQLARPNMNVATKDILANQVEVTAYPNPTANDLQVTFEIFDVSNLVLKIVDTNGRLVKLIHDDKPKRQGKLEFSMSTAPLQAGIYFLQIIADGRTIGNQKVVVQ